MTNMPKQEKEIIFSEEELKYIDKDDLKVLRNIKRQTENLIEYPGNEFCPICSHLMKEEVTPMSRYHYCEFCDYGRV